MAVEDAVEECLNELAVIFGVPSTVGDGIIGIANGISHGGSTEKSHDWAQLHVAIAFAFAGAFAHRATKVGEEAIGEFDADIGK